MISFSRPNPPPRRSRASSRTSIRNSEGTISFEEIIKAAQDAAQSVTQAFSNLTLGKPAALDFSESISAAQTAASEIVNAFTGMVLPAPAPPDFSGIISAAQAAATQVAQIFAAMLQQAATTAAQVGEQAVAAAGSQTAAQNSLIAAVELARQAAEAASAAAQSAAAAAQSAADAAQSRAEAGSYGGGGLFRGHSGIDTNLAWLTDMEFIMRPEAVMKYGVHFMDMINALIFPSGGYREGGLHRVMHSIGNMPSFNTGGLFRIALPAYAAGGINDGGKNGRGGRSPNMRPLSITIGGETFRGLNAPEDTAKALERAAIGRQTSATGVRPRWNK